MFRNIDLDVVLTVIGVMTAICGLAATIATVWLAGARERRIFRVQRGIFEQMLQQHASGVVDGTNRRD